MGIGSLARTGRTLVLSCLHLEYRAECRAYCRVCSKTGSEVLLMR